MPCHSHPHFSDLQTHHAMGSSSCFAAVPAPLLLRQLAGATNYKQFFLFRVVSVHYLSAVPPPHHCTHPVMPSNHRQFAPLGPHCFGGRLREPPMIRLRLGAFRHSRAADICLLAYQISYLMSLCQPPLSWWRPCLASRMRQVSRISRSRITSAGERAPNPQSTVNSGLK